MPGLRLVLPVALCVAATSLAAAGITRGDPVATRTSEPAAGPAVTTVTTGAVAASVRDACTPGGFDTRIDDEPWRGERSRRSERVFRARMNKEHPYYVSGRDGWKFFTDVHDENFSQAVGRVTLSSRQRAAWARWIRASRRTVEALGGRYFVVVGPANWDVYADQLPAWARRLRGTTSLHAMMRAYPDLPWIDTRPALRRAARRHPTYEPLNSHWTPYGGYVAWKAVSRCLRATDPGFGAVQAPPITGVGVEDNASEFAAQGVPDGEPSRTYPVYASPHPETSVTHLPDGEPIANLPDHETDVNSSPLRTETPDAQAPGLTLLTLRDSMGAALSPLWSWSFGTTIQYGHGINQMGFVPPDLAQVVATYRPDVVLFVITERWLYQRPGR